jgi:hypothetical protein
LSSPVALQVACVTEAVGVRAATVVQFLVRTLGVGLRLKTLWRCFLVITLCGWVLVGHLWELFRVVVDKAMTACLGRLFLLVVA